MTKKSHRHECRTYWRPRKPVGRKVGNTAWRLEWVGKNGGRWIVGEFASEEYAKQAVADSKRQGKDMGRMPRGARAVIRRLS